MTVAELKKVLESCPDDMRIEIPIRSFTKSYPVFYASPFLPEVFTPNTGDSGTLRMTVSLPEGMSVADRRKVNV